MRDQVPPVDLGVAWIGSKRKAALIGDVALADGIGRNAPGCHSAVLLFYACGASEIEEVGRPRLHELHQRAVRAYTLVTVCGCGEQHPANIGRSRWHAEISH